MPVMLKTRLPVLLSEAVAKIEPSFFWMGGGELRLKLGLTVRDFKKYHGEWLLVGDIAGE